MSNEKIDFHIWKLTIESILNEHYGGDKISIADSWSFLHYEEKLTPLRAIGVMEFNEQNPNKTWALLQRIKKQST